MNRLSHLSILLALLLATLAGPASAAPDEIHVAVIGDSLAFGAGDEAGKGIAGRLEPELRGRGVKAIATTNLGANGATTRDLTARLSQSATRSAVARADAIVLSVGANDLRLPLAEGSRRSPLLIIEDVLRNVGSIVAELRAINPQARILILGAYVPLPHERAAVFLEPLIALWDAALLGQFADDPLVSIVRMSDIVNRPDRLSRLDSFHPGGDAYQEAARRIAEILTTPS